MTMNNNANLRAPISMVHKNGLYLKGVGHRIYSGSRHESDSREHQHINLQGAPLGFSTGTLLPMCQDGHCLNGLKRSLFHAQLRVWHVWDRSVCISSLSDGLIVAGRMVSSGGGGAGRPLVRALWAGAQVLLLRASAGGDSGGGGGGGASLLLKVCDDNSHVAHRYSELLSRAPVHVLQFRSEV